MLAEHLNRMPYICILRGVRPEMAGEIAAALVEAGMAVIEVTMNSPDPCTSIARMREAVGGRALVGAGTVLAPEEVEAAVDAGAGVIIAPNLDPRVMERAAALGVETVPGAFTPSEAFAARRLGAAAVKLFPAEAASPAVAAALLAVWDRRLPLIPVGSIDVERVGAYWAAGIRHFGIGGVLYRPGATPEAVHAAARRFAACIADLRDGPGAAARAVHAAV